LGLDARLATLLCKKMLLQNTKKRKPDGLIQDKFGRIFKVSLWLKKGCFADDDDDDHHLCFSIKKVAWIL
jgi:hypothetical protein